MLKPGIVYRRYDEKTYVCDRTGNREFLFNETAGVVLDFLSEQPDAALPQLAAYLECVYMQPNMLEHAKECLTFLEQNGLWSASKLPESSGYVHRELLEHCTKGHYLYSATFELTYRCPQRCVHCYIDDDLCGAKEQELTCAEIKNVLLQLKDLGCLSVLFTGGEPCLRDDLIEILAYASDLGMLVDLYTTGIGMTDEQFDAICGLNPNTVSFSLYGASAAVHDAVTQVPGSFQKTLECMMMFKCAGINTYIKTIILKQNMHDLPNLYKLAKRLKLSVGMSGLVIPSHNGVDPQDVRACHEQDYMSALNVDMQYEPYELGSGHRDMNGPICGCGQYMLSIDPYGNINPCVAMKYPLGNMRTDLIRDIWMHSEKLKKLQSRKFCDLRCDWKDCPNRDFCTVCMGGVYNPNTDCFCPTEQNCKLAKATHQLFTNRQ